MNYISRPPFSLGIELCSAGQRQAGFLINRLIFSSPHAISYIFDHFYSVENKWKNVKISSGRRSNQSGQLREVRIPGGKTMLKLQVGGTVSSTSSVHPTRETWLNIQNSSRMSTDNSHTDRTTMRDLQEMFTEAQESPKGTSSSTAIDSEIYVTNVTIEKPSDSVA